MEHEIQMSFRGLESTDALKQAVKKRAEKLETFYDKIESCHVVVDAAHRHHRKGNVYHVRVRLTVPGDEIIVSRTPRKHLQHEDCYLAINDAFKETARKLEDYVRRRRGKVKHHEAPPNAVVARIFPHEGYGFLRTADGREIYFHANSLLDASFEKLQVGASVRFAEEEGDKGPQASTVSVVGRQDNDEL